jgi:HlyD family secretion protein
MKRWLTIIILVLCLAAAIGWRIQAKVSTTKALAAQTQLRKSAGNNVVITTAKDGDIFTHMDVVGSVNTPYDMKLASKISGNVDFLQVRQGDRVKAGQVLVRINPIEQEAVVAQDRSAFAEAQQKYTQALLTQGPNDVQVKTTISTGTAQVAQALANENQVTVNYQAQVVAAEAAVTDADAKVASAVAQQGAASQAVLSAQANANDASAKYAREYNLYKQGFVAAQDAEDSYAAQQVQAAAVGSAQQTLSAAQSAVNSAKAELNSAQQQLSITKKQGLANIVAAKAATRTAKETLKYSRSNIAQIPAYVQNLKALKSEVDAAKAQLDNAVQQVQDTILTTPYPGTVTSRLMDPGSLAAVGQQVLEVQFLDWLYVTCSAPVEYVDQTKVGQQATITFDALPGQTYKAPIVQVTPAADPTSRQFTFMVKLENSQGLFKPGMYGHVDVVVGHTHVGVLVPREAVINGDAGSSVQVVDATNIVHVIPVTTGASDPTNIEITSGIKPGEKIVRLSYAPLKDGSKVTVTTSFTGGTGTKTPLAPGAAAVPSTTTSAPGK